MCTLLRIQTSISPLAISVQALPEHLFLQGCSQHKHREPQLQHDIRYCIKSKKVNKHSDVIRCDAVKWLRVNSSFGGRDTKTKPKGKKKKVLKRIKLVFCSIDVSVCAQECISVRGGFVEEKVLSHHRGESLDPSCDVHRRHHHRLLLPAPVALVSWWVEHQIQTPHLVD